MTLLRRITPWEIGAAVVAALALTVLVALEPDILEAPFASGRALAFTVGGTVVAALALLAMLRFRVPAAVRLPVLAVPFLAVNWWLLSPYFTDEVVADTFEVSIADATRGATATETAGAAAAATGSATAPAASNAVPPSTGDTAPAVSTTTAPPAEPVLRGAGTFIGLAGHDGRGDAAVFRLPDGSQVLRFENFDIENGPDLRVYLVPGADSYDPTAGAIDLGALRGNVGDQTYAIPAGTELDGPVTALVWCDAFDVEFVAATIELR
ncbi:MAG: DM13 domain-containing protein [Acidimicrobiales bacterium]